jgi:NitT/TauT family transport system substrate-binding protein
MKNFKTETGSKCFAAGFTNFNTQPLDIIPPTGGVPRQGSGGRWGRNQWHGESKNGFRPQQNILARAAVLILQAGVRGQPPLRLHSLSPETKPTKEIFRPQLRKMRYSIPLFALIILSFNSTILFGATKIRLTLDWKPEPEFGGFYSAQQTGTFTKNDLDVTLKSAGEGAPTWQLVATGKTEFATTAADQVLIARSQGADVIALFAVYQTFPQGIMSHKSRGFTKLQDIFQNPGTLAAEDDTWLHFCINKFGKGPLKITSYSGGIAAFLAKPDYSQQCFVTSEPILARQQGADPQTFLIADAGYNPYTTVVITKTETVKNNPALVKSLIAACRAGWQSYLDDPKPANEVMSKLNTDMDPATFAAAAAEQKPLIETPEIKKSHLGTMTETRWTTLIQQLVDLKVIDKSLPPTDCFIDPEKLP